VKKKADRKLLSKARDLLAAEIVQVTGCTEPASVAFAFMTAQRYLSAPFDPRVGKASLYGSDEVLRNASTAVVPFLNRRGLRTVVAAGLSSEALSFDLFPSVDRGAARALLNRRGWMIVRRAGRKGVYVRAVLRMPGELVEVLIDGHHDEIRQVTRNGKCLQRSVPRRAASISIPKIMAVARARDRGLELMVREFIVRQVRGDRRKPLPERVAELIRGRMCGSSEPVITVTGSGNHGIFLGVPFYALYRNYGTRILPAVVVALLAEVHMTAESSRISEDCGLGTKASPALAAGLAFAQGAGEKKIITLMRSVSNTLRKLECHGAKASCGGKAKKAMRVVMERVGTVVSASAKSR